MRLSPRRFAAAISDFLTADAIMVREWCEAGILPAKRNPMKKHTGHWDIHRPSVARFLIQELELEAAQVETVLAKLKEDEQRRGFNMPGLLLTA